MVKEKFSIIGSFRNDRIDGEDQKLVPKHADVPITSYLDACELIIDRSENVEGKDLPSIKTMFAELAPQD